MTKKILTPILLLFFSLASSQVDETSGTWTLIAGNNKISEKWSIPTIAILQTYETYHNFQFIMARTGLTYKINNRASGTLGYDYLYAEPSEKPSGMRGKTNHLVFQEFVLRDQYGKLGLNHRYRLESIWTTENSETNFSNRVRYRLRLDHPIYNAFYAAVFDEILLNTKTPFFNHNRFFIGLGYSFSPNLKLETGYFENRFNNKRHERIRVAVFFKTDFSSTH